MFSALTSTKPSFDILLVEATQHSLIQPWNPAPLRQDPGSKHSIKFSALSPFVAWLARRFTKTQHLPCPSTPDLASSHHTELVSAAISSSSTGDNVQQAHAQRPNSLRDDYLSGVECFVLPGLTQLLDEESSEL